MSDRSIRVSAIPSGTVTFLFTDIEGSTQLLERLREGYAQILDDQRRILREALARWNGAEIDTQGDSIFAVFPRAIDAICSVMEMQRELTAHSWPEGVKLGVRMGLHTGEPLQVREGYIGMDVHRAARIAAAGHGGQVLVSQTTRDLVFQDLPKGTSIVDLGEHKLKDIRFLQRIYQLEIDGLAVEFPPLKTLSAEDEPPTPGEAPYKGLWHFDESDAEWFFGRERVSEHLLHALREQPFLAVIGASGSGKSSVIRAGLIPRWRRNHPGGSQVYVFSPSRHPLESMAISLTRLDPSVTAAATLIDDLGHDSRCLHLHTLRLGLRDVEAEILLIVDQFEELFTQCRDENERRSFVDNLLVAVGAENSPLRVLIALRADFYSHLAHYAGLRTEVAKHQEYLGAMDADELRQAIEGPAHRGGWELSPGLVELMLHDVGAIEGHEPEPGALPLLSHALLETWKRRRGTLMNLHAYSEAGGVHKAIAKTAEGVFYGELTPEQQAIARDIFLRLTELGEGTQDTRRSVSIHEIIPPGEEPGDGPIQDVLVKLADSRLITTCEDRVEVAHEALIREWPLLREWLAEDREGLRLHRHMTEAAQEWERLDHDPGALYRGARLAQAVEWAEANPGQLNIQEHAFLDVSLELGRREQAEREAQRERELEAAQKLAEAEKRRAEEQVRSAVKLRQRALHLTVALVLSGLLAVAAIVFGRMASDNSRIAQANTWNAQTAEARAELESTRAIAQQATAQSEALVRATAEANAVQQRQSAEEQADLAISRELAAAAVNNLETDPERSILLALEAIKQADTIEAESALHQAIPRMRLIASIPADSTSVYGVAFSPDGSKFATAGMDGMIKVWEPGDFRGLAGQTPLLSLDNPIDFDVSFETAGTTLAFSPDGTRLAGISRTCTARIWDARDGELLQTLTGHGGNITSLAFDPAGERLATSSTDGTAIVWEANTGQRLMAVDVPEYPIWIVGFTPDGRTLITGSDDALARFWDLTSAPAAEQFSIGFDYMQEGPPDALAFTPDGDRIAIASGQVARIWDLAELRTDPNIKPDFALFGHQNNISSLTFTPDGSRIVTGSADGTARVWDADTGQELFALAGGLGTINSLALGPDGIHPLSAHRDGQIRLWDISPEGSREWWTIAPAYRARISLDGKRLATAYITSEATGSTDLQMWELSLSGAKNLWGVTLHPGVSVTGFEFWPDLTRVATIDENSELRQWDLSTGEMLQSFSIAENGSSSGHSDLAYAMALSPDGISIATGGMDGKIILWDLGKEIPHLILVGTEEPVWEVAFSADGSRIASAGSDGAARVWDARTGELLQIFSGHQGRLSNVIFSPDGRRLLTASGDTTARIWDVETGEELLTLRSHTSTVFGLSFSPDGTRLATGSADGSAIVWDATSGEPLLRLPGLWVEFTPDGKGLMTISIAEMMARGFYLDIETLIGRASSRATRTLTLEECQQYLHTSRCLMP